MKYLKETVTQSRIFPLEHDENSQSKKQVKVICRIADHKKHKRDLSNGINGQFQSLSALPTENIFR
jgi:hypothetical protein